MRTPLLPLVLTATLVGCGPSSVLDEWDRAEIKDSESLRVWSRGSTPQLALDVGMRISTVVAAAEQASEAGCPVKKVEGEVIAYAGGCTDSEGTAWFGKASVKGATGEGMGVGSYQFEDFGYSEVAACDSGATSTRRWALAGTSSSLPNGDTNDFRYSYDLRVDQTSVDPVTCSLERETLAYSYNGQSVSSGSSTTWNGSGRIGTQTRGTVKVSTQDEVTGTPGCASEANFGTTTIQGKDTTAVITYDGATNCSEFSTVTWTLDGVEMGTVNGIACSTAAGAPLGFALLALLGLRLKRRRG